MSTVELATQPLPSASPAGLVPAPPPVPARSRLRGPPSNGNINGFTAAATSKQGSPSRTPRTPINQLPPSPSGSSIGSSSSASAGYATSPGVPVTPGTPSFSSPPGAAPALPPAGGKKYGSLGRAAGGEHQLGSGAWPGKLEQSPASPSNGAAADRRRSRFGRGRHSSSSSVTLSASADPMRIKDGVAPRGSSTGVYTPPTFPGPSPRPSMHSHTPSFASSSTTGTATRSASGSSESSTSGSSAFSIPQTPTSPSAAASRMYTACLGALSGWNLGPGSNSKRASNPAKPISGPIPGSPVHVESGPMSASAAYFPASSSRNSSFSQLHQHQRHQSSRSVSYTTAHTAAPEQYAPVQVWSPENGWTSAAAGLGVGVEEEGAYVQGRTRSSTNASQAQLGPAVIMADAPKGRRKPVPRVEAESREVHAL